MPFNKNNIIEQAKFTYSPLGKALQKPTKPTGDEGNKQVDTLKIKTSIKVFISKERLNPEIMIEIERIEEEEKS